MEFEAIDEGTLGKILVAEGAEGVKVGTVIALLATDGEDVSAADEPTAEPAVVAPAAEPVEAPAPQAAKPTSQPVSDPPLPAVTGFTRSEAHTSEPQPLI